MRIVATVKSAIQAAKSGLTARIAQRQADAAADVAKSGEELLILDQHAALLVSAEHVLSQHDGAVRNLEGFIREDPFPNISGNLRGFAAPTVETLASLAAHDAAVAHREEILAVLRRDTIEHVEKTIGEFELKHKAVLSKHGIL